MICFSRLLACLILLASCGCIDFGEIKTTLVPKSSHSSTTTESRGPATSSPVQPTRINVQPQEVADSVADDPLLIDTTTSLVGEESSSSNIDPAALVSTMPEEEVNVDAALDAQFFSPPSGVEDGSHEDTVVPLAGVLDAEAGAETGDPTNVGDPTRIESVGPSSANARPAARMPSIPPRVLLSTGVAVPQSLPTGTHMAFSVEYELAGSINPRSRFVWVVEGQDGRAFQQQVRLSQRGRLQTFTKDLRPEHAPFTTRVDEIPPKGQRRSISPTRPLK